MTKELFVNEYIFIKMLLIILANKIFKENKTVISYMRSHRKNLPCPKANEKSCFVIMQSLLTHLGQFYDTLAAESIKVLPRSTNY